MGRNRSDEDKIKKCIPRALKINFLSIVLLIQNICWSISDNNPWLYRCIYFSIKAMHTIFIVQLYTIIHLTQWQFLIFDWNRVQMQTIFKPSMFPIQFLYGVHFTKNKPDVAYLIEGIESVLKTWTSLKFWITYNMYILSDLKMFQYYNEHFPLEIRYPKHGMKHCCMWYDTYFQSALKLWFFKSF